MKRTVLLVVVGLVVAFVALQGVPYGRDHGNPDVLAEPPWDSAETQALFERACADCHSNETQWPWYSNVAPFSWLVQSDVDEGRKAFNTSAWGTGPSGEAHEAAEKTAEGEMPPWQYELTHGDARLSSGERDRLVAGLRATFGSEGGQGHDEDEDDD